MIGNTKYYTFGWSSVVGWKFWWYCKSLILFLLILWFVSLQIMYYVYCYVICFTASRILFLLILWHMFHYKPHMISVDFVIKSHIISVDVVIKSHTISVDFVICLIANRILFLLILWFVSLQSAYYFYWFCDHVKSHTLSVDFVVYMWIYKAWIAMHCLVYNHAMPKTKGRKKTVVFSTGRSSHGRIELLSRKHQRLIFPFRSKKIGPEG